MGFNCFMLSVLCMLRVFGVFLNWVSLLTLEVKGIKVVPL